MNEVNEETGKLIGKVLEVIEKQYDGYEIKVTGIHIEKILGENEYVITANFEVEKKTKDGTIVMEQKILFLKDRIKYTEPYKYIK
jgi:hypothetical protein